MGEGNALTVEVQQGVEDFALDLPGTLRHAGHPQPLVDGLGCHDVVARIGVNLPLGHRCAGDGPNPAQEGQDEAQQLQPRVGHGSLGHPGWLRDGRCSRWSLQRLSRGSRGWRSRAGEVFAGSPAPCCAAGEILGPGPSPGWRWSRRARSCGCSQAQGMRREPAGHRNLKQLRPAPSPAAAQRPLAVSGRAARWGSRRLRSSPVGQGALG